MPTLNQWRATWDGLGASASEDLFNQLMVVYGEPQRKYHTVNHLDECFIRFAELKEQAIHPFEIELAIWFHDAVYDTKGKDNEAKSAEWARAAVLDAGLSLSVAARVHALIMMTCHNAVPSDMDAQILVDVDLSILGADAERFDEYERQVREEYAWVPGPLFRRERKKILQEFLSRPHVYQTTLFRERYEGQARANLERSIKTSGGWSFLQFRSRMNDGN